MISLVSPWREFEPATEPENSSLWQTLRSTTTYESACSEKDLEKHDSASLVGKKVPQMREGH